MTKEKNTTYLTAEVTIRGAKYTITSKGEVFGTSGKRIKIRPDTCGYACFTVGKKGRRTVVRVHRLVAKLFLPNPNNYSDVDHLDSNRMNPSLENLEWVTHSENVKRAYARGNHDGRITGVKNPRAKLNDSLVTGMRIEYWYYSVTITELSKKYGVPWSTVSHVVRGETWKSVPMPELTSDVEIMLKRNPKFNPRPRG